MNFTKALASLTVLLIWPPVALSQTGKERSFEKSYRGVHLSVLSQRWIPKDKVPYVGQDFIDFSDMIVRFRLENKGKEYIYYLADNAMSSVEPVGFQLFRNIKTSAWEGTYSPAHGREGVFTGIGVHWLLLPPGSAIEFERTDVSEKGGEHVTTVFLNTEPEHKNRIELISDTYVPSKKRGTPGQ